METTIVGYRVWSFPKLGVPFWGFPIIRTIVYSGLNWVPLFWVTTMYFPALQKHVWTPRSEALNPEKD